MYRFVFVPFYPPKPARDAADRCIARMLWKLYELNPDARIMIGIHDSSTIARKRGVDRIALRTPGEVLELYHIGFPEERGWAIYEVADRNALNEHGIELPQTH